MLGPLLKPSSKGGGVYMHRPPILSPLSLSLFISLSLSLSLSHSDGQGLDKSEVTGDIVSVGQSTIKMKGKFMDDSL